MIFTGTDYADDEPTDEDQDEREESMYLELQYDLMHEEED